MMKDCKSKDCDYFKLYGKCTNSCIERGLKKTITNYDRIRNMSVEEMASFLNFSIDQDECFHTVIDGITMICESDVEQWLESEVDTE